MSTGNKIIKSIPRPSQAMLERFLGYQSANIGDCLNRSAALTSKLKSSNNKSFVGSALTVSTQAGDNLMVYIALDMIEEGDVLVISAKGYEDRAILGEIIAKLAQRKGIKAIIVEGAIRDIEVISTLNMPVYYTALSPNGPYKNGPGEINTEISIGSKIIKPGDIIVGDADGVVVVPQKEVENVFHQLQKVEAYESELLSKIEKGEQVLFSWAYEKIKALDTEIVK